MLYTFTVVEREVEFAGRQITFDVVRNDGKIVRSGMWPDYAAADCMLLNRYCSEGWSAEKYHQVRRDVMAGVQAQRLQPTN